MRARARLHAAVRGPVRTAVRRQQQRHPWTARPGTSTGPPDFVGIGAQRCGTSWWHALIQHHPQVADLGWGAKELHFFDDRWDVADGEALAEEYAAHFRRRTAQVAGEWTPRYLWDPWVVPLLARAAPDARLLVMLRDPVARFVSGLGHARKHAAGRSGRLGADEVTASFSRGLYGEQLERVLTVVPRDRLLVLQLEQCRAEPQRFLDRTFAFLGLEPVPVHDTSPRNVAVRTVEAPPRLLDQVRTAYRADSDRLAALFPADVDVARWRS